MPVTLPFVSNHKWCVITHRILDDPHVRCAYRIAVVLLIVRTSIPAWCALTPSGLYFR